MFSQLGLFSCSTRKNYPDLQKLSGKQCYHATNLFLSLSPGHQAELPWHPLPPLHQAPLLPLTLADLQAHRAAQGLDSTEPPDFEVYHPETQADQVFLSSQGIQGGSWTAWGQASPLKQNTCIKFLPDGWKTKTEKATATPYTCPNQKTFWIPLVGDPKNCTSY